MSLFDDPRVRRGMERQLDRRRSELAEGAEPLGWKAGFGTAAAMAAIGTDAPLAGYLTSRSLLPDGAELSLDGWAAPTVEAEIAVQLAADLGGDADRAAAAAAIGDVAPAIELVDLDGPRGRDDVETVLAGNVFHRHVVLGTFVSMPQGDATGALRVTVEGRDRTYAADADAAELIGDLVEVVRSMAALLADAGEPLRAGDVVITGAAVPPIAAEPGERVTCRLSGIGQVAVGFAR